MIIQLQHKDAEGGRTFVAQREFCAGCPRHEFTQALHKWVEGVKSRHPLPKGHTRYLCNQDDAEYMVSAQTNRMVEALQSELDAIDDDPYADEKKGSEVDVGPDDHVVDSGEVVCTHPVSLDKSTQI